MGLLAALGGCECLPEDVPCDTPSLGEGLDEERCVPGGTYTIGADPLPNPPVYIYADGTHCTAAQAGINGCFQTYDTGARNDWAPKHPVWLSPFYIDTYEVTNGRFKECVDAGACPLTDPILNDPTAADSPVTWVSWERAYNYCLWRGKRLPTEAEWESAGRGKKSFTWPWGNTLPEPAPPVIYTFKPGTFPPGILMPVGSEPNDVSPFGVHDLSGSAAEWVNDWYGGPYAPEAGVAKNPQGPSGPQVGFIKCCKEDLWRRMFSWNGEKVYRGTYFSGVAGTEFEQLNERHPLWLRDYEKSGDSVVGFRCARDGKGSSRSALQSTPTYRNVKWHWY